MAERVLGFTFLGEFEGPFLMLSSRSHTCLLPLGARPNDVTCKDVRVYVRYDVIHPRGRLYVVDLYLSSSG